MLSLQRTQDEFRLIRVIVFFYNPVLTLIIDYYWD